MSTELHTDVDEEVENNTTAEDELDRALAGYQKSFGESSAVDTDEPEHEPGEHDQNAHETAGLKSDDPEAPFGRFANGKPRKRPAKKGVVVELQASSLIDGALLILLMDILFPLLITFLNNRFSDDKIEVDSLQLTEKQKNDLKPVADAAAKQLTLKMNPTWLLVVAMGGIYGINYMTAKIAAKDK